jgi:hydroxyacylglutathione hydrolase
VIKVTPLRAFQDNYIWAIHSPDLCNITVVDPGDPDPVISFLTDNNLVLSTILITHHHWDHAGGIDVLSELFPSVQVYGPANETIPGVTQKVSGSDTVYIQDTPQFRVLDIPGHTKGHIAYYNDEMVFCGDTLFSAGCGRLFEGTAEQLFTSLQKLNALPQNTKIYCGHEYTLKNLQFAQTVEPHNEDIQKRMIEVTRLIESGHPSLPSTLEIERATNPFLRSPSLEVFTALRLQKDRF